MIREIAIVYDTNSILVMNKIPFHKPTVLGKEYQYMKQVIKNDKFDGSGPFNNNCSQWFNQKIGSYDSFLLPSCTSALEMSLLLADIQPEDEIILPSYTFASCATSILMHGGTPVFVDSSMGDFNLIVNDIKRSISKKTKVIMPMHYGGVGCDMNIIQKIALENKIIIIEDAAQGIDSFYDDNPLGSFGNMSAFSFHVTKNVNCGEGGMLCINDKELLERAYVVREKGTNRRKFLQGEVDKYSWIDKGSSYLTSEFQASFLFYQLENVKLISQKRRRLWNLYHSSLKELKEDGFLKTPSLSKNRMHNSHIYSILLNNNNTLNELKLFLKSKDIDAATHYVPLHSSKAGKKYGKSYVSIKNANIISRRLLRLPMFHGLKEEQVRYVVKQIKLFFRK